MADEAIYVVLVKAHTGLGKLARFLKGYEYTHVAVCLEKPFTDFITFSRRYHDNPFDCGFMHETLDCYTFGKHESVKLKIFRVPVTTVEKANICQRIAQIEGDPQMRFDILSMLTMSLFHGLSIPKAYNCMSFTGEILSMAGAVGMRGRSNRFDIRAIDELLTPFFYKETMAHRRRIHRPDYMDSVPFSQKIQGAFDLFITLFGRLITGHV